MADSPTAIPNLPPELANHPQYEVVRELGRGGMGVVYLARNRLMDRPEVLKMIHAHLLDNPGATERFLREIRAAAQLSHPNIVKAYTALPIGKLLALAMEYVEGQDLAHVVRAEGALPVGNACGYVQQVALALQHAFAKGMVHRDIKPQNLMRARDAPQDIIKVLDFGLAKVTREAEASSHGLTGTGQMLGTPEYIAPEQSLDAARADIRADLYSLGCTFYFLLTGRPPFQATSLYELLHAHQVKPAPPLGQFRADVPASLAAVVATLLAKDPAQRYQQPMELAQALAPFVPAGPEPVSAGSIRVSHVPDPTSPTPVLHATLIEGTATIARGQKQSGGALAQPKGTPIRRWPKWLLIGCGIAFAALSMGMTEYSAWRAAAVPHDPDCPLADARYQHSWKVTNVTGRLAEYGVSRPGTGWGPARIFLLSPDSVLTLHANGSIESGNLESTGRAYFPDRLQANWKCVDNGVEIAWANGDTLRLTRAEGGGDDVVLVNNAAVPVEGLRLAPLPRVRDFVSRPAFYLGNLLPTLLAVLLPYAMMRTLVATQLRAVLIGGSTSFVLFALLAGAGHAVATAIDPPPDLVRGGMLSDIARNAVVIGRWLGIFCAAFFVTAFATALLFLSYAPPERVPVVWPVDAPRAAGVQKLVVPPAVALISAAAMMLFLNVAYFILCLFARTPEGGPLPMDSFLFLLGYFLVSFVLIGITIIGGICMLRARGYSLAVAGSITVMFGTHFCLVGIPIGIWSLVILLREDVRAAFR